MPDGYSAFGEIALKELEQTIVQHQGNRPGEPAVTGQEMPATSMQGFGKRA